MEENCDALAAVLDERRGVAALRQRLGERPAILVDPSLAFVRPVGEIERRIAEGLCERVAKRCPVADRDREVGDPRSCEPVRRMPIRNATGMSASDEIAMSSTTSPADASIAPTTPLAKRSTRAINVTR